MFDLGVVLYLCLGGLGGGLSIFAGIAGLSIPRHLLEKGLLSEYSNLMRSVCAVAAASLVLGGLLLLADSGNFSALVYLFFSPSLNYLSVGAWAIVVDVVLCFLLVLFWGAGVTNRNPFVSRALHALCALIGLAVSLYTGLFLASMKAVSLWSSFWIPALFVLSSASCGAVVFLAAIQASGKAIVFSTYRRLLARVDIVIVVLESLCAVALVLSLVLAPVSDSADSAGLASAFDLASGTDAWIWWGGFVGLGLIMTAVFDVVVLRIEDCLPGRIWSTLGTSFCVLMGAFSLRYCIVAAGMHPALGF